MVKPSYTINCDGGSRGNPGPSGIGVVIEASDNSLKKEYGEYIGYATNNEAEYKAVIFGLKKLRQLIGKERATKSSVEVKVDSELLERQINGHYKISDAQIQDLFLELWNIKIEFTDLKFTHVPRAKNSAADRMVNVALDNELKKLI